MWTRWRAELWVLALALGVRLLWALAVPVQLESDCAAYHHLAANLARGLGYVFEEGVPSAFWPVGTSFFYSLWYRIVGVEPGWVVVPNLVCGVLLVFMTMRLAHHGFGEPVAWVAGLLLAVWPLMIQYTTLLASELLFTALLVGAIWAWVAIDGIWLRAVGVGVVTAAAAYVRPQALPLPLILGFCEAVRHRRFRRPALTVAGAWLLTFALILPWSYRNQQAFGSFVLVSANAGVVLYMGNNPDSQGNYMDLPQEMLGGNDAERDRRLRKLAVEHIKERPDLFLKRSLFRLRSTWDRETIGVVWNPALPPSLQMPLKLLSTLWWYAMLLLGGAGAVLWFRRSTDWREVLLNPYVVTSAAFAALYTVSNGGDRYHVPTNPLIAMLAAGACVVAARRFGWLPRSP